MSEDRVVDVETRKAGKDHSCVYCKKPIQPGMKYVRVARVRGENFYVVKFHKNDGDCGYDRVSRRR